MRREFSKEFKRYAIRLVLEQGYTRVKAAKSLGIAPALFSRSDRLIFQTSRWLEYEFQDESLSCL